VATAPNPLLMALMQRLAGQGPGAPGAPGGMPPGMPGGMPMRPGGMPGGAPPGQAPVDPQLEAARAMAMTPYGKEKNDLRQIQTQLGSMVPRFLQRDSTITSHFVSAYKALEKAMELIDELPAPAMPMMAPPPGMPPVGGAGLMSPADLGPPM
jgi:hypothetical protein